MLIDTKNTKIFLYRNYVDMRKGHDALSYLVTHQMNLKLLSGAVFVFVGRNRKVAKAILWDGTGLVLVHKKLEKGKFMHFDHLKETQEISTVELSLILEGNKIKIPLSRNKIHIDLSV